MKGWWWWWWKRRGKPSKHSRQDIEDIVEAFCWGDKVTDYCLDYYSRVLQRTCDNKGWDAPGIWDYLFLNTTKQQVSDSLTHAHILQLVRALAEFTSYRRGSLTDRLKRAIFHSKVT